MTSTDADSDHQSQRDTSPPESASKPEATALAPGGHSPVVGAMALMLSGAAWLLLGIVWTRQLQVVTGHGGPGLAVILCLALVGYGLGAHIAAARVAAGRIVNPVKAFALLHLAAVAWTLLSPLLLKALHGMVPLLTRTLSADALSATPTVVRVLGAIVIFLVPALIFGAALPLMSQAVARRERSFGRRFSALYGCQLLGAGAGAWFAVFVLLPALGYSKTSWIGACLLIGAALISGVLLMHKTPAVADESTDEHNAGSNDKTRDEDDPHDDTFANQNIVRLVTIAGITGGLCFFLLFHWTRLLELVFGGTLYTGTVVLTLALAGAAFGSFSLGWLSDRKKHGDRVPSIVSLCLYAAGVWIIVSLYQFAHFPASFFERATLAGSEIRWPRLVLTQFGMTLGTVFLPALGLGAVVPLATRAVRHRDRPGTACAPAVARVSLAFSAGGALGVIFAVFLVIPHLGVHLGFFATGALTIVLALGAAIVMTLRSPLRMALPLLTIFLVLVWYLFREPWDRKQFAIGALFRPGSTMESPTTRRFEEFLATSRLSSFREGLTATNAIFQAQDNTLVVTGSGRVQDATSPPPLIARRLASHLGALLHPGKPARVLNVGFGAGLAAGALSRHEEVEEIHALELEPVATLSAQAFRIFNHDVLASPKLTVGFGDARTVLAAGRARYDLVTASPPTPDAPAAAALYTRDFFRLVHRRLNEKGVFCQLLPADDLDVAAHVSLVGSFVDVFPASLCFTTGTDLILVGFRDGLHFDLDVIKKRLRQMEVTSSLNQIGFNQPAQLWSLLLADFTRQTPGQPKRRNTDDFPFVTFNAPRVAPLDHRTVNRQLQLKLLSGQQEVSASLVDHFSEPEQVEIRTQQGALVHTLQAALLLAHGNLSGALESIEKALLLAPQNPVTLLEASNVFRSIGENALYRREETNAITYFEKAFAARPSDFRNHYLLTVTYLRNGDHENAAPLLEKGRERYPNSPRFFSLTGSFYLERGEFEQSLAFHALAVAKAPDFAEAWEQYGIAAQASGNADVIERVKRERRELLEE